MNFALNAGSTLEFIRLPFQRGGQPKMVQNSWPQFGGYPTDHLDRGINVR